MVTQRDRSSLHYLGNGWAFPVQQTMQGGIQLSYTEQSVEESILLILRTQRGERVYRPNFGSRLAELAFAPINTQTLMLIRLHVEEALQMWEPRIWLESVLAEPSPDRGRVDITILYRLRATRDRRSLVYPFYLTPTEESSIAIDSPTDETSRRE